MSETNSEAKTSSSNSSTQRGELFPRTQWSMISQAREADEAGLRQLATSYWRPLYLYLRKRGDSHEDASDFVQSFFEFVFSSGFLTHVEREGGKFRSYFLRSLERWRGRQLTRERAQKRGGQVVHVELDGIEEMEGIVDSDLGVSAEKAFDRQWAIETVGVAVEGLRESYVRREREKWFDHLRSSLPGGDGEILPYAELAALLETSEGAIKKAVFDLRAAFAAELKETIRATVRTNEDAEEELRYLVSVMG